MHIDDIAATSLTNLKNMPPAKGGYQVHSAFVRNDTISCHLD